MQGAIDIIPAGTPSFWEISEKDAALIFGVTPELLQTVAAQLDCEPRRVEIKNRFQMRDAQLENIAWALKAEMESGYPSGRLYRDSLAVAVAARLITCHSSVALAPPKLNGAFAGRRLKQVLAFIKDNLSRNISLGEIAASAGLSVSHFKVVFRETLRRLVHRARCSPPREIAAVQLSLWRKQPAFRPRAWQPHHLFKPQAQLVQHANRAVIVRRGDRYNSLQPKRLSAQSQHCRSRFKGITL